MAKIVIYAGATNAVLNKTIYIMDNFTEIDRIQTTDKTVAEDIYNICEKRNINEVHLYGPKLVME